MTAGASDWEADEGAGPRTFQVQAFRIDVFEVTRLLWSKQWGEGGAPDDPLRAASGMTREEASLFCASRGGRLPSEAEWMVAAMSPVNLPRRYPWGETGAVCRRAAWGLESGPCATNGRGPDTVGAHRDGDSPLGLHDLSGNVAEWVAPETSRPEIGIAKGGSWQSRLASELRIWARLEVEPRSRDPRVGLRCVYPP